MPVAPVSLITPSNHGVEQMTKCQICGAVIKDDMNFCVKCTIDRAHSQALKKNPNMNSGQGNNPEGVVCFVCGERLGPNIKKCGKCGTLKQDYSKVLKWLLKSAKDGDDCAQQRLADMYLKGIGTDRDYNKALAWYLKSAEQDNDISKVQLGYMYEQSLGVDQDYQKALALYRESAEAGNALGQARLGDMYLLGLGVKEDYRKALALYQESAEQGNGHSQAQLASMYLHGVEVERDYQKALAWYQKSVEQGNDEAQVNLGCMVEKGLGVDKDFQKALGLYKKSAEQGNALGQARLGDIYLKGLGVEQDPQKAFKCFQKAAAQNNDLAQLRLGTMYCEGNGVEQDLKKGFALVQKSANQGNAKAQLILGGMYKDGKGVQQDSKKAFAWIQKSAKQGHVIAQNNLGYLYEQGLGVDRDFQKAREWYLKAAEKGLAEAQVCLGNLYRDGLGVEENITEAKKWYVKASEKGNEKAKSELLKIEQDADPKKKFKNKIVASYKGDAKAMAEVANMYLMGIGIEKSEEVALEWFKKAFEYGNVSVRGKLQQVQQSINAKRKAENKIPEKTSPTAAPVPSVPKKKSPVARTLFFLIPMIVIIGLSLTIIFLNFNKKSGSLDNEILPVVPKIAAAPQPKTEPIPLAILETSPEAAEKITMHKSTHKQKEKKSFKIAEADHTPIKIEPTAAVLRREYKSLNEQEISEMLIAKNIFDAKKNPSGNFRHQYEIRNVAGLRVIFDRATKLAWIRQQNFVKMNLEKTKDWIGSLNNVRYGGISNWRLPTVEEAASLLEKNPADEKIFLAAIFGKDIKSIWTGDSFTESKSWIIDFQNGLLDYEKNKNRLPALMVSSDLSSTSNQVPIQETPATENKDKQPPESRLNGLLTNYRNTEASGSGLEISS
jgi:TPR repeat protein